MSDAASTAVGIDAACALRNNGEVSCWGSNAVANSGDGTTTDSSVPVAVVGAANTAGVSAGASHACAVTGAAKVRCWGANSNGQLGDGTTTDSSLPVLVSGLTGVKTVAAGADSHAPSFTTGEALLGFKRSWPSGRRHPRLSVTPVAVSGLTDATDVATGLGAGCASRRTEGVTCWGQNVEGQLGDGTTVDSPNRVDVIAGLCQEPPDPGFSDVPSGVYYTEAVAWLVGKAITTGTSPGIYSPTSTVSRAQMAVFLWRAAGEPAAATPHSFGDVVSGSYYEDAVSWLVEAGITTGTSPGVYSPEAAVSRAQMAVFLHRATGELEAAGPHGFTDVQSGSYYEAAVTWLASVGISDGTAPGTYSPFTDVNRAQMAVFLHRRGCGISVAAVS
ncbi:MAG: S-layer homology domain-containing protein [Microthrixaceae bacterium]